MKVRFMTVLLLVLVFSVNSTFMNAAEFQTGQAEFEYTVFKEILETDSWGQIGIVIQNQGDGALITYDSNSGKSERDQIFIVFNVGPGENDLTGDPASIRCSASHPGWVCEGPVLAAEYAYFSIHPVSSVEVMPQESMSFLLDKIRVNPVAGKVYLGVVQDISNNTAKESCNNGMMVSKKATELSPDTLNTALYAAVRDEKPSTRDDLPVPDTGDISGVFESSSIISAPMEKKPDAVLTASLATDTGKSNIAEVLFDICREIITDDTITPDMPKTAPVFGQSGPVEETVPFITMEQNTFDEAHTGTAEINIDIETATAADNIADINDTAAPENPEVIDEITGGIETAPPDKGQSWDVSNPYNMDEVKHEDSHHSPDDGTILLCQDLIERLETLENMLQNYQHSESKSTGDRVIQAVDNDGTGTEVDNQAGYETAPVSGNSSPETIEDKPDAADRDSNHYTSTSIIKGTGELPEPKSRGVNWFSTIVEEDSAPRYKGDPMTLRVVDADIVDIFTQISELAGKNVVVDPNVRGDITLRMNNVPWDQVLTYILKVHDLGIEEEGNVIRIAKMNKLKKERDEEHQLREAEKLAKDTRMEIVYLSYAKAGDLSSKVKQVLSKRGEIIVDTRTNSIIINDIPEYLIVAKRLISTLDIRNRQVTIFAQIISSKKSFSRSLGIQWGGGFRFGPETGNPGKYAFPYYGTVSDGSFLNNASPFAFNLPPTDNSVPFFGLTFGNVMDSFQLRAALHAAESEGLTRIVASPRITTSDNVSADIRSGVEIPYSVLTDRGVTTDFRSATISINVTPHITIDDNINLRIRVTNDSVDRSFSPPGKIINSANTELLIGNGETFVIGGLAQSEAGTSNKRFPWLHRIPGIGKLFRSREIGNTFNDLLIFITPQIVKEEEKENLVTKDIEVIQEIYP